MKSQINNILLNWWVNICRFLCAAVFLFSGFVKAVDPVGTQIKFQDYLAVVGMENTIPDMLLLFGAIGLAMFEFVLGIYFLFGIRRKFATVLLLLFMLVMTPLTLYLAIADPVEDCGCFGDAVKLTNWQTFYKNLVLLVCAVSLYRWSLRMLRFLTESTQWLVSLFSIVYILVTSIYSLRYLPIYDFRPYKVGVNIAKDMEIPEGAPRAEYETTFFLEKNGKVEEFTLENYPDSTWKFIDSKSVLIKPGFEPKIQNFSISTLADGDDITEDVLSYEGYTFLLIAPYLEKASDSSIDLINELYDYSQKYGYRFYCLTSSTGSAIDKWVDETGAAYQFCNTDATTLQTMIRSNPGLMLLKNGTIINKWSSVSLPDEYELTAPLDKLPIGKIHKHGFYEKTMWMFAWYLIPLLVLTVLDRMGWLAMLVYRRRKRRNYLKNLSNLLIKK